MKKIVKILPFYEPRMWGGGERLKNEFNYHTDVKPLGEVYNVVALQGLSLIHIYAYLPVVTPFQIFLSSYYCLLLTLICGIWVVLGAGREGEHKYSMTYHHAKE